MRIFKRIKQKSTLDLSNQLLFTTSSVVSKTRRLRPETCIQVDIDRLCLKNNLVMMLEIRFSCYSASYQSMRAGFELKARHNYTGLQSPHRQEDPKGMMVSSAEPPGSG